jgi:hypothetical protein
MVNLTALTLLPQEQLSLASHHEVNEMHRYRQLAMSFLPTAPPISRLMAALGMECEQRLDTLKRVAEQLELGACVTTREPGGRMPFDSTRQHFFVVDEATAKRRLEQALENAQSSLDFFDWLLATNATPELYRPLLAFVTQKRAECRILQEIRDQGQLSTQLRQA